MATTNTNPAVNGVSLIELQKQIAAMAAAQGVDLADPAPPAAPNGIGPKTALKRAPKPAMVSVGKGKVLNGAKPGTTVQNGKLVPPATVKATAKSSGGSVCGAKSPNGPCLKCNGAFNPILHFSLDEGTILVLDGNGPITAATWDKDRKMVGISVDEKYWGNVVTTGFGRDSINMKPKTFLAMAHALGTFKAADHVMAVLPESLYVETE